MNRQSEVETSVLLPNIKTPATSTVRRKRPVSLVELPEEDIFKTDDVTLLHGDSLQLYSTWDKPTVIVSDGAYGVLGFEGDTSDHLELARWYEPHVKQWSEKALPSTTLWFWNSEIGWAVVHPILEKLGWRYVNSNIWNKGKGHIAGNVNTAKIRRFPVVTEICVQYVFEAKINERPLKEWLLSEWKRTGLKTKEANAACGVKDAAVRKYLDQSHLWYFPPAEKFQMLVDYANSFGSLDGRPYFSFDGKAPLTGSQWALMRSKFYCPHGFTNVWNRNSLRGDERVTANGKAVHLNQKPLDLMEMIIKASSEEGDTIWEPFGGLFSASLAATHLNRKAFSAELDSTYFQYGVKRFLKSPSVQSIIDFASSSDIAR